jgi:phosphohistidine phosphatase
MQLLVIRHGIAEDKEAFAKTGKDDSLRPLTKRGEREMRLVAKGLKCTTKIGVLASSELVRAQQTAAIIAREYGLEEVTVLEALAPDARPNAVLKWLRELDRESADTEPVAVIGHEPHLSGLVTWLLTRQSESRIVLKKGGACCVGFAARPAAGRGELRWLMTPTQLRLLGD